MLQSVRGWAARLAPVVLLGLAGWVLWRELGALDPADIGAAMVDWGAGRIAAASLLAILCYALLAAMEWLGLRWSGASVSFRAVLVGSFCANAFAHTIGFAVLVGGAVRAKLYARDGASLLMVAQTSLFCSASFGLGVLVLGGLALLSRPDMPLMNLRLHPALGTGLGAAMVAATIGYIVVCAFVRRPIRIAGRQIALPSAAIALGQVAVGLLENAAAAAVVWVLLEGAGVDYTEFAAAYVVGVMAGVASSVPGGAGVFEGVVLTLLPQVPRPSLAAALVGFRLIYYVIPLVLAAAILMRSGLGPKVDLKKVQAFRPRP